MSVMDDEGSETVRSGGVYGESKIGPNKYGDPLWS